jgi:hypothetical protein
MSKGYQICRVQALSRLYEGDMVEEEEVEIKGRKE